MITVNGVDGNFHTSCSKPIYLGLVLIYPGQGTLTIIDFESTSKEGQSRSGADCDGPGTPPCRQLGDPEVDRECNICATDSWEIPYHHGKKSKGKGRKGKKAKLSKLELEYTGINCVGSDCNMQNDKKARVEGDPASADGLIITILGGSGETFEGINVGDKFIIEDVPHPATIITLTDPSTGSVLSLIEFHSSCSVPLYHGDEFGSLRLVGFETTGGLIDEDKCNVPEICTTTVPPTTAEPTNPPCDACGGAQGSTVTMLRFQIVAGGASVVPNNQGGSATVIGTTMPVEAVDPNGKCHATMQRLKQDPPNAADDLNDLWTVEHEGCDPFAARLVCTNDAGIELETQTNQFNQVKRIAKVPSKAWNILGPKDSESQYIVDGSYVIVHNNGAGLGDKVTCRIQSPEHYCFAFAHGDLDLPDGCTPGADCVVEGDGVVGYEKFTHLSASVDPTGREQKAEASSIFHGCAASRTDADQLVGCACLPETQTAQGNDGSLNFPPFNLAKGDEGNFATDNPEGAFDQTIEIDISCQAGGSKTLNIDDMFGMFKLVGFSSEDGRNDMECDACPCNPDSRKVCQGPAPDASDTFTLAGRHICDLEKPLTQNAFECAGNGCVDTPSEDCTCGTVTGEGSDPQDYCLFAGGSFGALEGDWKAVVSPTVFIDLPAEYSVDTEAVADNVPCCDHYWYTCAILQDAGTSGIPRTGNWDYLATTPEGNILAALGEMGVDFSKTGTIDHDTPTDKGNQCQVQVDPILGLGDVSLVLFTSPVTTCFNGGVIDLYCDAEEGYRTSINPDARKFCCLQPFGLLDSATADLSVTECDLVTGGSLAPDAPPGWGSLDWTWANFLAQAESMSSGNGGEGGSARFYGFGFGSCAIVCCLGVAAYAVRRSRLTERRKVTMHPSSSTMPSTAPTNGVYDFESSCGDSIATDAKPLSGMAAAAATVEAANLEWESEPAAAQRVANSLRGLGGSAVDVNKGSNGNDDDEPLPTSPTLARPQLSEGSGDGPTASSPVGSVMSAV